MPTSRRRLACLACPAWPTINRAAGVLIARDHQPDDAHETLQRQAAASGFEPHAWAIRLLRSGPYLAPGSLAVSRVLNQRVGHGSLAPDADLPPHTILSGVNGVDELSMINRAVMVLIERGHPGQAHAMLRRQAAATGLGPHTYPARLLRRWPSLGRSAAGWFRGASSWPAGLTLDCAAFVLTHPTPHAMVDAGQQGPI